MVSTGDYYATVTATEILNLDTMTWRNGTDFGAEARTFNGASIPYRNSFLAIGGYTYEIGYRNETWYFNPDTYTWEVMSVMEQERYQLTAIPIPEYVCN